MSELVIFRREVVLKKGIFHTNIMTWQLLIMHVPFGIMGPLGIYCLASIIINNGIDLIDRIEIELPEGKSDYQAIINSYLTRLRPIAMTTVTTIMGLFPLMMNSESMFYGMATGVIRGQPV